MAHVLVTGANRGLGLEFVRQLLARGERVVATCRQPGRALPLNRLAGEYPGHLTVLPLTLPEPRSIAELARELDALDVRLGLLINNAGASVGGERFGTIALDGLRHAFDANAAGPLLLTQALAPRLDAHAKVVNLSSGLGSIAGTSALYTPSYAISKAALNMASKLLSIALAEHGAIVAALSPGWVRTDMGGANAPLGADESVAAMLRVIDRLRPADNGRFLAQTGAAIDW
ncbi:SDR family oxidoreductase [Dokdonella sp.]|uniref:SDR family oxidoreductase n=1 Tax=Dokdonella sp. TaxID=2291710 RepID=UPI001B1057FF|nr:SDR family oxidoreductase [Dokdonella sp.]MBO9661357.1 SDR family oxidoreductase [Dokdonella sp.]